MIPTYYYVGGATGGSAVLGAVAMLMDRDGLPKVASHARYIASARSQYQHGAVDCGSRAAYAFPPHAARVPSQFSDECRLLDLEFFRYVRGRRRSG